MREGGNVIRLTKKNVGKKGLFILNVFCSQHCLEQTFWTMRFPIFGRTNFSRGEEDTKFPMDKIEKGITITVLY